MSDPKLTRTIEIFTSRLQTLKRLLDMAAAQWRQAGRDPEALVSVRLADNMFALPFQVAFACVQARNFATYVLEGPRVKNDPLNPDPNAYAFADLAPLIDRTIAHLDKARTADPAGLVADKRVDLRDGAYMELPGATYVEDWLIPHFYFHVVTAYDILRHAGVKLGKPDYMAHLGPYLRNMPQAPAA